ncbi:MAG: hypothetical protein AB7S90_12280 [Marinobacterium sp.]|jgi:hypothetical protein
MKMQRSEWIEPVWMVGISARDILVELGRRGTVGGQEDMIEDLALTMSKVSEAKHVN